MAQHSTASESTDKNIRGKENNGKKVRKTLWKVIKIETINYR